MRIIGHRGTPSCPHHPENTLQSIRAALEAGADGVEIDVQAARDGVLVLAHDPDLGRILGTGPRTGPVVADSTFAELHGLGLPNGARVPTLVEALDLAAEHSAYVITEVKPELGGAAAARTARLLGELLDDRRARRPGADRVSTSSFDLTTAASLAGRGTVSAALIVAPQIDPDVAARRAWGRGVTDVHLNPVHVRRDPAVVARLQALGLLVGVGVVNDPVEARLVSRLGAEMTCTDEPVRLVHALATPTVPACSDERGIAGLMGPASGMSVLSGARPRSRRVDGRARLAQPAAPPSSGVRRGAVPGRRRHRGDGPQPGPALR
jgi:glycerophosphoryl diester phosphodiesterase